MGSEGVVVMCIEVRSDEGEEVSEFFFFFCVLLWKAASSVSDFRVVAVPSV